LSDSSTIDERDLTDRVASLSLEQKVRLLTGGDSWSLRPEPDAGLRRIVVSDGPAGVRGERWDERDASTNLPSATGLAATWDEALVQELGGLLAGEARRMGVDVVLAPTVNLHRTPYAGRHFECFSEDPLLTARIGTAYVRGLQEAGVAATVKHFIANDSETERTSIDVEIGERTLRELYLAPFEAIVHEAGAWALMASYNRVNGEPMTESSLLREILRREFRFDGLVMSDWFATRSTEASARAALDLVMPGPDGAWGDKLLQAVRDGKVDRAAIDEKVTSVLRLAARVGALDGYSGVTPRQYEAAEIAGKVRRAAAAGFVLASNGDGLLPLDRLSLRRVAVIGPNASVARIMGGGSATVFPPYAVSPLEGLRTALEPAVKVEHSVGVHASSRIPAGRLPWLRRPGGGGGVEVRFLADDGTVLAREDREGCSFSWPQSRACDDALAWIEVHTILRAIDAGTYAIAGSGIGRLLLSVDGEAVFDVELEIAPDADVVEALVIPPQAVHHIWLERGEEIDVVLAYEVGSAGGGVGMSFQLGLQPPQGTDEDEIERATSLARDVDVVVLVVGTTDEVESEGFDRASLSLPGRQDELVRRVCAVNPKTVVVVNTGAPVLLPWADDVAAVLLAWFPGQEFGNALADVLLGLAEPGGRLPTTWPTDERLLPPTRPVNGILRYDEGLSIGYRRSGGAPRYPFGHGLGYTSWRYDSIDAQRDLSPGGDLHVSIRLSNTGPRRGREIVQVYASRRESGVERPLRWLAGFASVDAVPGEQVTASVMVKARAFEHWDVEMGQWLAEPGTFQLAAGPSSARLPLGTEITMSRGAGAT